MKLDCVPKDFVRRRFVLAIFAIRSEMAYSRFSAINFISPQRSNAEQNPLVRTFIIPQTIPLPSYSFNGLNCTSRNRQFNTRDTYNNTSPLYWGPLNGRRYEYIGAGWGRLYIKLNNDTKKHAYVPVGGGGCGGTYYYISEPRQAI